MDCVMAPYPLAEILFETFFLNLKHLLNKLIMLACTSIEAVSPN